jgi:hypothetical protein
LALSLPPLLRSLPLHLPRSPLSVPLGHVFFLAPSLTTPRTFPSLSLSFPSLPFPFHSSHFLPFPSPSLSFPSLSCLVPTILG